MADSTKGKNKKKLDVFADDLEAMLNNSEAPQKQTDTIEDDDAIDRLLMTDHFQPVEEKSAEDSFNIDSLIAEEFADKNKTGDFDEVLADFQITPTRQAEPLFDEFEELIGVDDENRQVKSIDEVTTPELSALERVEDIDEFADRTDQNLDFPALVSDIQPDDNGVMAEIDEFSDDTPVSTGR